METNLSDKKKKRAISNEKVYISNKSSSGNSCNIKDKEEKEKIYHRLSQLFCSELFTAVSAPKPDRTETEFSTSCSCKRKLAHLVSLMEEIKRYNQPNLNQWLEIEQLELLLDLPEIADRDWSKENLAYQHIFLDFLNIHIFVYEKAIRLLNEKTNY